MAIIDEEIFYSLRIEEFEDRVCKILLNKSNQENDKMISFFKDIYATYLLDGDVLNGGFNQYYVNQSHLAENAINGFKAFEANAYVELVSDSQKYFLKEKEKNIDIEEIDFSKFDSRYEALSNFYFKRLAYIIKHIERFFDLKWQN